MTLLTRYMRFYVFFIDMRSLILRYEQTKWHVYWYCTHSLWTRDHWDIFWDNTYCWHIASFMKKWNQTYPIILESKYGERTAIFVDKRSVIHTIWQSHWARTRIPWTLHSWPLCPARGPAVHCTQGRSCCVACQSSRCKSGLPVHVAENGK